MELACVVPIDTVPGRRSRDRAPHRFVDGKHAQTEPRERERQQNDEQEHVGVGKLTVRAVVARGPIDRIGPSFGPVRGGR